MVRSFAINESNLSGANSFVYTIIIADLLPLCQTLNLYKLLTTKTIRHQAGQHEDNNTMTRGSQPFMGEKILKDMQKVGENRMHRMIACTKSDGHPGIDIFEDRSAKTTILLLLTRYG